MSVASKNKRFRLSFVGPIEDQPRLIRAYGRACDGEFALVMRPREGRAVLVLITKESGAFVWKAGTEELEEDMVRAKATVLRDGRSQLRVETGFYAGSTLEPRADLPAGVAHGDVVEVVFTPGERTGRVVNGAGGDALLRPETPIEPADAVALITFEQKHVPKPGPTTLRGRWSGHLYCDGGKPRVELRRKLASYGTLTVSSHEEAGWAWTFVRSKKWFSKEGDSRGEGITTLSEAIEAGVLGAMALVREACSFRDTRRRAAHHAGYAGKHPIRAPKAMKDPTRRLRSSRRKWRAAPPPKAIDDGGSGTKIPRSSADLGRMAQVVKREGDALVALSGGQWIWEDGTPVSEIADWFGSHGLEEMGEAIRGYEGHPEAPLDGFLDELGRRLSAAKTEGKAADPGVYEGAQKQLAALGKSLRAAPAMMERARKLIRYARAMVKSPICKGQGRREALAALEEAVEVYEEARSAVLEGQAWDVLRALRTFGEKAVSCSEKARRGVVAEGFGRIPTGHHENGPAGGVQGWKAFEVGDRAVFKGLVGTVSRVPGGAYAPGDKVSFLADGRSRGRRVEARLLGRNVGTVVDADKDRALVEAFRAAVSAQTGF